jgi:ABC-type oligopeptide transport system substrate-binding subunit
VRDGLTVQIRLVQPDADFLGKLSLPIAYIVDRRAVELIRSGQWIGRPTGTGPWMVEARDADGSLELVPRRHFYDSSLQLRSLLLMVVPNQQRALELYRKGVLDAAQVPDQQYGQLSSRPDFHHSTALDAYYALPIDSSVQVLAAILDRDKLAQDATPAISALSAIVPPAVPDYVASPPTIDPPPSSSGSVDLPRVNIVPRGRLDWTMATLRQALYRQWPATKHGSLDIVIVHATSLLPVPSVWLRLVLAQTQSQWFRNILRRSGGLTNDPVERMSAYSREENWAIQTGLIVPLASRNIAYLVKSAVGSLQVTPVGIMPENNTWSSITIT